MFGRLWCNWFHKKMWEPLDSRCHDGVDPTATIQLVLDHCKKCDRFIPAVFRVPYADTKLERLV
jgi:hypothetical protein